MATKTTGKIPALMMFVWGTIWTIYRPFQLSDSTK